MKHSTTGSSLAHRRLTIAVRGVVQGVGFRPFVYQAACAAGLTGWVRNEADMVRIEVQGDSDVLEAFVETLRHAHPPQSRIDAIEVSAMPYVSVDEATDAAGSFQIRASAGTAAPRPTVPADLATCVQCLAEIRDPQQRRYNYPFTNCTNCGPRWSIIEQLPYDRPRTSMSGFAMCEECRSEYDDPADRRFHAQPIACPRCGPTLELLDRQGRRVAGGEAAMIEAVQAIVAGCIVAIKGLGGFQLLADATNAESVAQLRRRKHRPDRPFALMLPSLDGARRYCCVLEEEARELSSHRAPIVLLPKRMEAAGKSDSTESSRVVPLTVPLAEGVAPGNPYLGVMLPYTPLHHLLMTAVGRPIVCTSGNLSEEPMAITIEDALARLSETADLFLTHNRPIARPVDDSIVRFGPTGRLILRRARGFAPLPIELRVKGDRIPTILAVGGHLKNTVALLLGSGRAKVGPADVGWVERSDAPPRSTSDSGATLSSSRPTQVVVSAHVGDLDSVSSVEVFRRAVDDLLAFFQAAPDAVVCDLHPDYASTRHAELLAARWGVPLLRVQHHHAHVAACMAEHGLQDPVLGFSWDGTGYGLDGTAWGGEALLCRSAEFVRAARLRTFALPGGDRAAREPRRSALGLLFEILGQRAAEHAAVWFEERRLDTLISALKRGVNAPRTSSLGRLFDAVAAICGLQPVISFEGQAAMALEFVAEEHEDHAYPLPVVGTVGQGPRIVDWEPLIRSILTDRAAGVPVGRISARFHNALAEMAVTIARQVAKEVAPASPSIVLSGGCFQNALLSARVHSRLSAAGLPVYTHSTVPPGDGGIALGQVFVGLQRSLGSFDVSRNTG
jgi:hydrogenase maturation protein HypF